MALSCRIASAMTLTSATKSNGIAISMPYWDERFHEMAKSYPEVKIDQFHMDALTAQFVLNPSRFDVLVGSNLFGDILVIDWSRLHRDHRHRTVGQHQPREAFPFPVRAGARLCSRHRRAGHRQSSRRDLGCADDAGASGRAGGG